MSLVRIMLRLSILSSIVPLVLAGGVAHDWTQAAARQCFAAPSIHNVTFTADPLAATVKVQIVGSAELADLAIADDSDAGALDCRLHQAARFVSVSPQPRPGAPVVYLTQETDADYRVYVSSATVTAEQAAALIVAARGGHTRLAAQPFDTTPTGSIPR
jgi:hypothetical protein